MGMYRLLLLFIPMAIPGWNILCWGTAWTIVKLSKDDSMEGGFFVLFAPAYLPIFLWTAAKDAIQNRL